MRLTPIAMTTLAAAFLLAGSGVADAQYSRQRYPNSQTSWTQQGYQTGYQQGLQRGERDARDRRGYDISRHGAYRDADSGYRSTYGDRSWYRDWFRRGFEQGYRDGYSRYGGSTWGGARPGFGGYGGYGNYGGYRSPAFDKGYDDGYRKGLDAAKDRDRYDPLRERWYRDGDRGYNKRYGPRASYEREYREGFRSGYDRGYREYTRAGWRGW